VSFSIPNGIIEGKLVGFQDYFFERLGLNPENTEGLAALQMSP
jgi:hypothetical protein